MAFPDPRRVFSGNLFGGGLFSGLLFQGSSSPPVPSEGPVCGTPGLAATVRGTPAVTLCGGEAVSSLYVGNDMTVSLSDVTIGGMNVTDATVTYALYNKKGVELIAPTEIPFVSVNDYAVILESSVIDDLIADDRMRVGRTYRLTWRLVQGDEDQNDARWDVEYLLQYRAANC